MQFIGRRKEIPDLHLIKLFPVGNIKSVKCDDHQQDESAQSLLQSLILLQNSIAQVARKLYEKTVMGSCAVLLIVYSNEFVQTQRTSGLVDTVLGPVTAEARLIQMCISALGRLTVESFVLSTLLQEPHGDLILLRGYRNQSHILGLDGPNQTTVVTLILHFIWEP